VLAATANQEHQEDQTACHPDDAAEAKADKHYLRGLVVFSLPGYSRTGRAVVHVTYSCGMLCGTAYVIVLQRSAHGWTISQVVGSEIT
jgi:hypothetical protein